MKPPPIGEALSAGYKAFKSNLGPNIIAFLCALLVGIIPFFGWLVGPAGWINVGLKIIRGQKPEPKDGFCAFDAPVDYLVVGLLQACGLVACCIGVFITAPLFLLGFPMVSDKKMKWEQAKDACMAQIKPNFIAWFVFLLVIGLFVAIGAIAISIIQIILGFIPLGASIGCVITIVLSLVSLVVTAALAPVGVCAIAYAYDKASAGLTAPPPPPAPAPAA